MKLTTKWSIAGMFLVVGAAAYLFVGLTSRNSSAVPVAIDETTDPAVVTHASYEKLYSSVVELYQNSDLVAEVKVQDQETILGDTAASVQTLSHVLVKQVYKGDVNLKTVPITESGGISDFSKLKGNEVRSSGHEKPAGIEEVTREGSPVIKPGYSYIVFLKDTKDPKWGFTITGSVQGKIRFDEGTGQILATVQNEIRNETGDLFFLQNEFAGKDKNSLVDEIKKTK
ncbi:hypothetical protein [Tumebacillus permanentifrigoris]|uniref:Uncharacterized protein n=1 Tax=Tumebacillus permanentifrigoris TaxID=378543 RepID=A0A316D501_9BACL|nr:hypothetical protein [Tumebacillus permanentifrigoris]PWK07882.1 hypothetical protein C7459_11641 [Tumebacillus permanentifrigoris]